jgi:hypothetical protein
VLARIGGARRAVFLSSVCEQLLAPDHLLISSEELNNAADAVGGILALIKNVDLVAGPFPQLAGILAAQEHAAVGIIARPEFRRAAENFVRWLLGRARGASRP